MKIHNLPNWKGYYLDNNERRHWESGETKREVCDKLIKRLNLKIEIREIIFK